MFELEVDHDKVAKEAVPEDIRLSFEANRKSVRGYAILPWEEHCTECAMPQCYLTCDLYEARKDGKCRRFIGGISPLSGVNPQIVQVAFKRWGQLMAYGNAHIITPAKAGRVERAFSALESLTSRIPDGKLVIKGRGAISARALRKAKQSFAKKGYFKAAGQGAPDCFLLEIYNPNPEVINLSFVVKYTDPERIDAGYQELVALKPGFNAIQIDYQNIVEWMDLTEAFEISLNPNILDKADEGLTLYFGLLSFADIDGYARAKVEAGAEAALPSIKVVAWDLDNTLWDGILVEDGADKLVLKPGIEEIIKTLDERGILNSVVSKNNPEDALPQLERMGLQDYFVHPKISWEQKGLSIKELIEDINVGANTFAFIDDSPFERDEVKSLNPDVRVYDALQYEDILSLPEFNPRVSTDSSKRRKFYQNESARKDARSTYNGEYLSFLRNCEIKLTITKASPVNIDRIQELVQRTNQLNFSGNRYQRDEIKDILENPALEAFVIECQDRYGAYGTVGFAIVDTGKAHLIDMMFSCRVQSKRVEQTFITFLMIRYKALEHSQFLVSYHQTERNKKAGVVFSDMKFTEQETNETTTVYSHDLTSPIIQDDVMEILWEETP